MLIIQHVHTWKVTVKPPAAHTSLQSSSWTVGFPFWWRTRNWCRCYYTVPLWTPSTHQWQEWNIFWVFLRAAAAAENMNIGINVHKFVWRPYRNATMQTCRFKLRSGLLAVYMQFNLHWNGLMLTCTCYDHIFVKISPLLPSCPPSILVVQCSSSCVACRIIKKNKRRQVWSKDKSLSQNRINQLLT